MSNVKPNVTPQAASPAHSDMSKNTSRPDCSAYSTPNSAAEQTTYRSIGNPMSGDDAKAADGDGSVGGSPGVGNVRRPILTLKATARTNVTHVSYARPQSAFDKIAAGLNDAIVIARGERKVAPRAAPMGSLLGVRTPIRRPGR